MLAHPVIPFFLASSQKNLAAGFTCKPLRVSLQTSSAESLQQNVFWCQRDDLRACPALSSLLLSSNLDLTSMGQHAPHDPSLCPQRFRPFFLPWKCIFWLHLQQLSFQRDIPCSCLNNIPPHLSSMFHSTIVPFHKLLDVFIHCFPNRKGACNKNIGFHNYFAREYFTVKSLTCQSKEEVFLREYG